MDSRSSQRLAASAVVRAAALLPLALAASACSGHPPADAASLPAHTAQAAARTDAPPADAPRAPVPRPPDVFDVSPAAEAFARAPKLPAKLARTPYAYFRFINAAFSETVCRELGDFAGNTPSVPLHGDAHLEQYALTDIGRGLTDFDDAATGPAIVDLARMATSLVIAARMRGFGEHAALAAFADGYRLGLRGGTADRPRVTAALRARFRDAPAVFLAGADKLMLPEDADPTLDGSAMRVTVDALEMEMRARQSDMPTSFFGVKKIGIFKAGVGSALERKFLVRLEGASPLADDDRILEVKFIGDRTRPSCIQSRYDFDPRDLREDMPPGALERFVDPTFIRSRNAWAQEWYPNFREIAVEDLTDDEELAEVARDAGALLAREHVRGASPESLALDAPREVRLQVAAGGLATRVEASWKRFKGGMPQPASPSPRSAAPE